MIIQILILAASFFAIIMGAHFFVEGSSGLARKFKIPEIVIGLTIVAIGTSLPEASVSISASISGSNGISIGNVLGSNILNILLILGVTSFIASIPIASSTIKKDIPVLIISTLLLALFAYTNSTISRLEGLNFLLIFISYIIYLVLDAKKEKKEDENKAKRSLAFNLLFIALGLTLIVICSKTSVDSATKIAKSLGVEERIIGLTIVAFGTSLPELVTSIVAARKGNTGIAVGNIVGSNIFNLLFILGATAVILPISFDYKFMLDIFISLGAALLIIILSLKNKRLGKLSGIIMLILYILYFTYLILI